MSSVYTAEGVTILSFDKNSFNGENILSLVNRAQAGDSGALTKVLADTSPFVHVLVRNFLDSSANVSMESDDLFQEGMLGVLSAVKSYDSSKDASFKTYVAYCVRNRLISASRKRSESSVFTSETVSLENSAESVSCCVSVEDAAIGKDRFVRILEYINSKLSETELKVLKLFLSGLSYEEIALKTDITVKSVDNALQRARQKIRNFNL